MTKVCPFLDLEFSKCNYSRAFAPARGALVLKDKTGKEIHGELADVYRSSASSYALVKFRVAEFKRGRTSLEDEARSGRPLDATDKEMCKKYRDLVYSDRRIQIEEIVQALSSVH